MPRSKPDNVQVHRIELGHWERERVKDAGMVATTAALLPAIGIGALGLGIAGAGYALYQWLKTGPFQEITETIETVKENLAGPSPFSPEMADERQQFREENPTLWEQSLAGPGLLWDMIFG
jgi:hypothetical protein